MNKNRKLNKRSYKKRKNKTGLNKKRKIKSKMKTIASLKLKKKKKMMNKNLHIILMTMNRILSTKYSMIRTKSKGSKNYKERMFLMIYKKHIKMLLMISDSLILNMVTTLWCIKRYNKTKSILLILHQLNCLNKTIRNKKNSNR